MRGFETYSPLAWLEDIFSVHLTGRTALSSKEPARAGRWSTVTGNVVVAAALGIAVTSAQTLPLSGLASERVQVRVPGAWKSTDLWSLPGYVEAISGAMRSVKLLPAPALNEDPDFQF